MSNQTFNANIVSALIQSTFCYMRVEIKILSSFFPTYVFCICPPMFDRNYLQLTKESTVSAESSLQFSASKVLVLGRNIPARLFLVFSSSFFPHSLIQLTDCYLLRGVKWDIWYNVWPTLFDSFVSDGTLGILARSSGKTSNSLPVSASSSCHLQNWPHGARNFWGWFIVEF